MLNGNYGDDNVIGAFTLLIFGAAGFVFLIWLISPYNRLRLKIKSAAKTTAVVNGWKYETRRAPHGVIRYACFITYSFTDGDEFREGWTLYSVRKPRTFEDGDKIEIIYDKNDTEKSVPVFLLKRERSALILSCVVFTLIFGIIVYSYLCG